MWQPSSPVLCQMCLGGLRGVACGQDQASLESVRKGILGSLPLSLYHLSIRKTIVMVVCRALCPYPFGAFSS